MQGLVFEISILPTQEYINLFKRKLKDEDIVNKITFGRLYEDLYYSIVDEETL